MKVILTGSTGFIGHEVLEQCLQNSSITSIIVLTRSDLPSSLINNPKLRVTLVEDFLSYPESLLQNIKGAEACIWSLGKARMPDNDTARQVSVAYTLAAAKAFTPDPDPQDESPAKKFRFVYLSGAAAERDQTKPLWFMQDYRRIRGQAENALLSYAGEHRDRFEAYIMRPGFVLAKETTLKDLVRGMGPSVRVDVLATAMLRVTQKGSEIPIVENTTINLLGR